jgi:Lysine methyltransferase
MSNKRQKSGSLTKERRVIFPDVLDECHSDKVDFEIITDNDNDHNDYNEMISNVFFDLANSPEVLYRVRNNNNRSDDITYLTFKQDMGACSRHTGGIIWETSYLLLEYLIDQQNLTSMKLGRTLELGAGVGFLGQCLVAERFSGIPNMVLTETDEVVTNLKTNIDGNRSILLKNIDTTLSVCTLDWTCYAENITMSDGAIHPHSFDTLLGTDIIFASHLVEPLLQTAAYLSHHETIWYLCVQIRCAMAHQTFLDQAPKYGFNVCDISSECYESSNKKCTWGKTLDCFLFRITRM